jgi:16S rRNA pseudouridine516 synthase
MKDLRLDKFLTEMGKGSRSQVKTYISKGRVTVNGEIIKRPEYKISPEKDVVNLEGEKVNYSKWEYYMLNKPAGCVSATEDKHFPTVISFIEDAVRKDLFPVGRLDKDTEGLLLITNDGALAHELLSPKKHVAKTYYARIEGKVTAEDVAAFRKGLDIGEKNLTKPAELVILKSESESEIEVTITEGKYHQIKRMFEKTGKKVIYLKRLSMGSLKLDETLATGAYRPLTESELQALKEG